MRRLTLGSPSSLRELIHALLKTPCEPHFLHRLHCVLLIAEGRSCYEVARWYGWDPRTIEHWVRALGPRGVEGLAEHHGGGRPTRLSGELEQRLSLELREPPNAVGYAEREWTGRLLAFHLAASYGTMLSPRQCQRMLRRLARAAPNEVS